MCCPTSELWDFSGCHKPLGLGEHEADCGLNSCDITQLHITLRDANLLSTEDTAEGCNLNSHPHVAWTTLGIILQSWFAYITKLKKIYMSNFRLLYFWTQNHPPVETDGRSSPCSNRTLPTISLPHVWVCGHHESSTELSQGFGERGFSFEQKEGDAFQIQSYSLYSYDTSLTRCFYVDSFPGILVAFLTNILFIFFLYLSLPLPPKSTRALL